MQLAIVEKEHEDRQNQENSAEWRNWQKESGHYCKIQPRGERCIMPGKQPRKARVQDSESTLQNAPYEPFAGMVSL